MELEVVEAEAGVESNNVGIAGVNVRGTIIGPPSAAAAAASSTAYTAPYALERTPLTPPEADDVEAEAEGGVVAEDARGGACTGVMITLPCRFTWICEWSIVRDGSNFLHGDGGGEISVTLSGIDETCGASETPNIEANAAVPLLGWLSCISSWWRIHDDSNFLHGDVDDMSCTATSSPTSGNTHFNPAGRRYVYFLFLFELRCL